MPAKAGDAPYARPWQAYQTDRKEKNMNAEFIYRPVSGQYPEKHFGNITPNCLWVKFEDKDEQEWVGSFEQSWVEQGSFIINLTSKGKSFVVAGGQTFLIDINTREQLNNTEITDTKTAIIDEKGENIYYSNGQRNGNKANH